MPATIVTASIQGNSLQPVTVEVDIGFGLPYFILVGLANKAIREARERVRSAIRNSKLQFPRHRLTVNLAPATAQKHGSQFDAAIAVGILLAQKPIHTDDRIFIFGELSLDGKLQRTTGVLAACLLAQQEKIRQIYVPLENIEEARLVASQHLLVYAVPSLETLVHHLYGRVALRPLAAQSKLQSGVVTGQDYAEIATSQTAIKGLVIAAAGLHNVLLAGPPGIGKTALAQRLISILPPPTREEQVEIQAIRSLNSSIPEPSNTRPFREPHHTTSFRQLVQSEAVNELALAHRGVILFDELPEFSRTVLTALRQIIDRTVPLPALRLADSSIPLQTLWVATQNLCPCGRLGSNQACACTSAQMAAFQRLIDKPILDRIDIYIPITSPRTALLRKKLVSSREMYERVVVAREQQQKRFGSPSYFNSQMSIHEIEQYVILNNQTRHFIEKLSDHYRLSGRAYHSLLRVARTIADIDRSEEITEIHLAEAIQYRVQQV